jgi:hypothetical protein
LSGQFGNDSKWQRYEKERHKFRCPYSIGKIKACLLDFPCSPSPYGRVIYISNLKMTLNFLRLYHIKAKNG